MLRGLLKLGSRSSTAAHRSSWPSSHASCRTTGDAVVEGHEMLELSLAVWWQFCKRWASLSHSHLQLALARPLTSATLPPYHSPTGVHMSPFLSNTGSSFAPAPLSKAFSLAAGRSCGNQNLFTSRSFGSTAERSSWWRRSEPPPEEPVVTQMEPLPVWSDASYFGNNGLPPPPKLMASQLACIRGGEVIFRDINLSLHSGSAVNMTGPNGSGKTSMLRVVSLQRNQSSV